MAIRANGVQFRQESPAPNIRGNDEVFYYLYDPNVDKWLSVQMETITLGRNASAYSGFLRSVNGILTTASFGPDIPHDGTLVALTASATNTPNNIGIRVYNNGNNIFQTNWASQDFSISTDVDFSVGNLSVDIRADIVPPTKPNYPIVQLYAKWRL